MTAASSSTEAHIASQIVSPVKLAHVVMRTSRFPEMVKWYSLVLNAKPAYASETITFLSYDDEHHRVALINVPGLARQPDGTAGVHHIAFTYRSLSELLDNFARLNELGVKPVWSVNHGPTTSLYYEDPDGNQLEFQVDNYDTIEAATEFFFTDAFARNPIGVDFDPAALRQQLLAGGDEKALKLRPPSGARGVEDIPIR